MQNLSEKFINDGQKTTFNEYLTKVFFLVFVGTLTSLLTAAAVYFTGYRLFMIIPPYLLLIVQLGIAWFFSFMLMKMSKAAAWTCYIMYSAILGISLSVLPLIYEGNSILLAVGGTVLVFGSMAIIGHRTRIDLTKFAPYLMIGLVCIIVITLLNMLIFHQAVVDLLMSYLGIILFLAITAYDVQNLRRLYLAGMNDSELSEKLMIYGAFQLYLDFVNLFIRILEIFGRKRN